MNLLFKSGIVVAALLAHCDSLAWGISPPSTIGPGVVAPLSAFLPGDYRIVPGTSVTGQSSSGAFALGDEAVNFAFGGNLRIDGGTFQGGAASYNGPVDQFASIQGGVGVRVASATAEIYGGAFQGGSAFSSSQSGAAAAGAALALTFSEASIYGGTFEGGPAISPGSNSTADIAVVASTLHVYGGAFSDLVLNKAMLHVYGRDLVLEFGAVRGTFRDGKPASFRVFNATPGPTDAIVIHNVPEAGGVCIVLPAMLIGARWGRRRRA
jgi:hypothetical protein